MSSFPSYHFEVGIDNKSTFAAFSKFQVLNVEDDTNDVLVFLGIRVRGKTAVWITAISGAVLAISGSR